MSFNGSLSDLPLVDVLQLLNATKKTGTLNVAGPEGQASLTLREGFIVSASHPNKKINIGSVLVGMGIASPAEIEKALSQQGQNAEDKKPILSILIDSQLIEKNLAFKALERLIEMAIGEMIKWKSGTFTLDSESVVINDDFRFSPEQISSAMDVKVDTQQVLLNALRALDETRDDPALNSLAVDPAAPTTTIHLPKKAPHQVSSEDLNDEILGLDQLDQLPPVRPEKQVGVPVRPAPVFEKTLVLFSTDFSLIETLKKTTPENRIAFFGFSDFKKLTDHLQAIKENAPPTVVLLDAGPLAQEVDSQHTLDLAKNIMARFPLIPIGFIYPSDTSAFAAILPKLGNLPALNKPTNLNGDAGEDFLHAFFVFLNNLTASGGGSPDWITLKSLMAEMLNPSTSVDVSARLLKILSRTFKRLIVFGIKKDQLIALDSMGFSNPIADLTFAVDPASKMAQALEKRQPYYGEPDVLIRQNIFSKHGPPNQARVLTLPLRSHTQLVALIYADFGDGDPKEFSLQVIEVLAIFSSILLENSLYEKQIQKFSQTDPKNL